MLKRLGHWARSIEESWIGDLISTICFVSASVGLYFILFAVMP